MNDVLPFPPPALRALATFFLFAAFVAAAALARALAHGLAAWRMHREAPRRPLRASRAPKHAWTTIARSPR